MQAHVTTIETLESTGQSYARWRCSCGLRGNPVLLEHVTWTDRTRAVRRVRNGGVRHVAAMERSK